jgi:hypothetical protein
MNIMMRHRSPNSKGLTETTVDIEEQKIGRNNVDQKGQMTFRNKFQFSLRCTVLLVSGLLAVLYCVDFLLHDHARSTSTTPITTSFQHAPLIHVRDSPTVSVSTSVENARPDHGTTIQECGIWMAPSSLRPNPGFGIFTTRDISYKESILHQPDAVAIPVHDMRRRNNMPFAEDRRHLWMKVFGNVSFNRRIRANQHLSS